MPDKTHVELIPIGTELLRGTRIDTNSAYIGAQLEQIHLEVSRKTTVGDAGPGLSAAVREAWERSDLVITCGGLGPTVDDLTREALVAATGAALREEPAIVRLMQARFAARGYPMPETNRCQALVPVTGRWFRNDHGTAPGLCFEDGAKTLIALPGPPNELRPMFAEHVLPYLARRYPSPERWLRHTLRFAGLPESTIDADLRPLLADTPAVQVALLPSLGIIELTLSLRVPAQQETDPGLERAVAAVRRHFGAAIFAEGDETLPATIGRLLHARGWTLALAESCTGGLIGGEITAVPGSSDYFLAGLVVYSNQAKTQLLGVPEETLARCGAVSRETVEAMAAGVRTRVGADTGLAITGIAGPGGGTPEKPVGTVHVAACDARRTLARAFQLVGDRDEIRKRAVVGALTLLYELLTTGER